MYERAYGKKYDGTLDVAEIAKLVRKEIKAAVKSGDLPALKVSVRISRFSGGRSLNAEIVEAPSSLVIWSPERVKLDHEDPQGFHDIPYLTEEAKKIEKKIEAIIGAYNHDGSDSQSDYFDVNFYSHLSWGSDLVKADKARTLAKLAGEPEPEPEPPKKKEKPKPTISEEDVEELLAGLRENPEETFAVFELSGSRLKRAGWTGKLKTLVRTGIIEVVKERTAWNGAKIYRLARSEEAIADEAAKVARATELGKAAFERGDKCAPHKDPELKKLLDHREVDGRLVPRLRGNFVLLMKAWNDAWTRANLAALLPGVSTLEHPDADPDLRIKTESIKLRGPVFQAVRAGEC